MRGYCDQTFTIQKDMGLTPLSKIIDIKKIISKRLSLPQEEFSLIFANKWLGDDQNSAQLLDYGIRENSTLMMVTSLAGGAYISVCLINGKKLYFHKSKDDTV